jgi:hypothetical protein
MAPTRHSHNALATAMAFLAQNGGARSRTAFPQTDCSNRNPAAFQRFGHRLLLIAQSFLQPEKYCAKDDPLWHIRERTA